METFLGTIMAFPFTYAPRGWHLCDGRTMLIREYSALYSLLGTQFGGDGQNYFKLPQLASPGTNLQYYIAMDGTYPSRN